MRYLTIEDANRLPAGWEAQPKISRTGSVRGMIKLHGWKPGHAFQIGGYIYHFAGGECYYTAQRLARGVTK